MRKSIKVLAIALMICTLFISCKPEPEHEHVFSIHHEAVAATCADGHTEYWECECGEKDDHYEVIPATGSHDFSATCTQGHEICAECGTASDGETIDNYVAKQSDWSIVDGKTVLIVKAECGCELIANAAIGSVGPAGGYIFYDVDADNTAEDPDGADDKASETCGWKYLEGAPSLLKTKQAINDEGEEYTAYVVGEDDEAEILKDGMIFGYYMKDNTLGSDSKPIDADHVGVATLVGTGADIGKGKSNTEKLIAVADSTMTAQSEASSKTKKYGALICSKATCNVGNVVYDDWFLPSVHEMIKYFDEIVLGKGFTDVVPSYSSAGNKYYMTSTEKTADKFRKLSVTASERKHKESTRAKQSASMYILPVRSF